jgi:hypothetical protein
MRATQTISQNASNYSCDHGMLGSPMAGRSKLFRRRRSPDRISSVETWHHLGSRDLLQPSLSHLAVKISVPLTKAAQIAGKAAPRVSLGLLMPGMRPYTARVRLVGWRWWPVDPVSLANRCFSREAGIVCSCVTRQCGTSLVQLLQVQHENTVKAFDAQDLDTVRHRHPSHLEPLDQV